MTIQRFVGSFTELGEREVGVIASTDQLARDGHILEPSGLSLTNFKANPIVLWNHNPNEPIGAATAIGIEGRSLAARIEFAPVGASMKADEICSLVKSGVVKGVSIGFEPIDGAPLDPKLGSRGGMRITASELLEISFCVVPVDTGAGVVARSFISRPSTLAMLRSLPAVGQHAIERAMAKAGYAHSSQPETHRPIALMSDVERTRFYAEQQRARTMTTWAIGYARDTLDRERRRR